MTNVTQLHSVESIEADVEPEELETTEAQYHTVLEVWREVLKPAAHEATKKVTPAWAMRIVAQFPLMKLSDMVRFRDLYYGQIQELYDILLDEISTDSECLNYTSAKEDVTENSGHYRELLFRWQERILQWELAWDTTSPDAAVEVAAISEVHKMFFSQTGITAFLDNIKFEFDETDQAQMQARLEAIREGE